MTTYCQLLSWAQPGGGASAAAGEILNSSVKRVSSAGSPEIWTLPEASPVAGGSSPAGRARRAGPVGPDTVYDPGGEFHEAYAPRGDELCVIRPDGHIGARAALTGAAAIEVYLAGLLAGVATGP